MEKEILEEQRIFQEPLERFRERYRQAGLALVRSEILQLLEILADLQPLVSVLLLRLLRRTRSG